MKTENKYLIVIAGPTAVGKTDLSIRLANYFQSAIVSADSRQFYKEMNIGTAKPSSEQLKQVPHYFIGTKQIDELYGAGHYEKEAIQVIEKLFETHRIVFLVGGSGLYINAVLNGVDEFIEVPNEVRENIVLSYQKKGIQWLQEELFQRDKAYYETVDLNNSQRLMRALEVCIYTGKSYSSFLKKEKTPRTFKPIKLLINMHRDELYERINTRVDDMMKQGLLEEVKRLSPFKHLNALKTVGYKELYDYLDGKCDMDTAVEKIKQHSRNYAKRQLTWFKNQDTFVEFSPDDPTRILEYLNNHIQG